MSIMVADAYWLGIRQWRSEGVLPSDYTAEERQAYWQGQEDGGASWEILLASQATKGGQS